MFYFLVSKFIAGNNLKYIFIIGSICYIILHAYLFGNNSGETTQKFRQYLYYLFAIDAILTGSYIWLFGESRKTIEDDEIEQLPEIPHQIFEKQDSIKVSNIEDIHRKLLEVKAQRELKQSQNGQIDQAASETDQTTDIVSKHMSNSKINSSPFAKKDVNINKDSPQKTKQLDRTVTPSVIPKSVAHGVIPKSVVSRDVVSRDIDDDDNDDNPRSYDSRVSNVSIPLYGSEHDIADTEIPLYMSR